MIKQKSAQTLTGSIPVSRPVVWLAIIFLMLITTGFSRASVFDGSSTNFWLVDEEGRITSYTFGTWLETFAPSGQPVYSLAPGQQGVVNNVSSSSTPMTSGQPAISLIGLASAQAGSSDTGQAELVIAPAPGDYEGTINVELRIDESLVEQQQVTLSWQINGGAQESRTISPQDLNGDGIERREGYIVESVSLVRDGAYTISASLEDGAAQVLDQASANYQIQSNHPDGFRRDSDGDGIPDLVELELGLDPLESDFSKDSDGDGWSDFDEWLRSDSIDPQTGEPFDSDNDGWSDFDENLRNTNPNDPVINLTPGANQTTDSEAFRQQILAYKDFPAAGRLYEVEYAVVGSLAPQPAEQGMIWNGVSVFTASGNESYSMDSLLSSQALTDAGVSVADIDVRRQLSPAETALLSSQLPQMRVPAGESSILQARHGFQPQDENAQGFTQVYKHWFNSQPDADPKGYLESQGPGDWQTAEQWKQAYIAYLGQTLVASRNLTVSLEGTKNIAVLEGALSFESRLSGEGDIRLFGAQKSVTTPLISEFNRGLSRFSSDDISLDDLLTVISTERADQGILSAVDPLLDQWLLSGAPGSLSDVYVQRRLIQSFDLESLGCFVTDDTLAALQADADAMADFMSECPEYYTTDDLLALQAEDAERRYQIRLALLPGAPAQVSTDNSLLVAADDSDGDSLANAEELNGRISLVTLPWLSDQDNDGVVDGSDLCPTDPFNQCSADPDLATVELSGEVVVTEPGDGGGFALVSFTLSRAVEEDVIIEFSALSLDGDTALRDTDYEGLQGEALIRAGERVAVISIPILADGQPEGTETFSVQVTGINNAQLGSTDTVTVIVNDSEAIAPVANVASAALTVSEGETVVLDASSSSDPAGLALSYLWQQTDSSGVSVSLDSDTSELASFQAPQGQGSVVLQFVVTVTNNAGLSDQASVQVTVEASNQNQPPQTPVTPVFTITAGGGIELGAPTLLDYVEDPEGESVSLTGRVIKGPDHGILNGSRFGYEYEPTTIGEPEEQQLSSPVGRDLEIVDEDNVLFIERRFSTTGEPDTVVHYQVRTGQREVIFEFTDNIVGSFVTNADQQLAYFNQFGTGKIFLWELGQPLRSADYSLPFPGRFIVDDRTGDAYVCDIFDTNTWHKLDRETLATTNTGEGCEDAFTLSTGRLGGDFCAAQTTRLVCTNEEGGWELRDTITSGQIRRVVEVDEYLMVMVGNVGVDPLGGGDPRFQVWLYTSGGDKYLMLDQSMGDTLYYPDVLETNSGRTLFTTASNQAVQFWFWDNDDFNIVQRVPGIDDVPITYEGYIQHAVGSLQEIGDTIYWQRQVADFEKQISKVDISGDGLQEFLTYTGGTQLPNFMSNIEGKPAIYEGAMGEGVCNLLELAADASTIPVIENLGCYTRSSLPHGFVFRRTDSQTFATNYYVYRRNLFVGTDSIVLEVVDESGVTGELPVEFNVVELP